MRRTMHYKLTLRKCINCDAGFYEEEHIKEVRCGDCRARKKPRRK
jgi:DNA-directed RNA polymerase subunit RPC12/RpoP